jgi:hypothetical protein
LIEIQGRQGLTALGSNNGGSLSRRPAIFWLFEDAPFRAKDITVEVPWQRGTVRAGGLTCRSPILAAKTRAPAAQ